jgi:hypothetical protein
VNTADAIFATAYRPPRLEEWPLDEIEIAVYLQLLEDRRQQILLRLGLDPQEYSFEADELP